MEASNDTVGIEVEIWQRRVARSSKRVEKAVLDEPRKLDLEIWKLKDPQTYVP